MKKGDGQFVKFLGTAGARFVMIRQLRASGGIWISAAGKNIIFDPGPGSIVHCNSSRPKLDPSKLDAIILSHRHLDHSADVNVMIEAMTEGGFKKRGTLFCPEDGLEDDPVVLRHTRGFLGDIQAMKENSSYDIGGFNFRTSMPHIHPVRTLGIKFKIGKTTVAFLTDTRYFPELIDFYSADILVISVVFYEPRPGVDHLCLADAQAIISRAKPARAILTHFGMTMLKAKPHLQAQRLSSELGIEVVAAYDGMTLKF